MKLSGRDWVGIIGVALLIGLLGLGVGKGRGKTIPLDDRHRSSYQALKEGRDRAHVELICTTCHNQSSQPLPKNHPPKEQCLVCHDLVRS
ncbi:cytochrome c [Geomonas limicola]|uniref:Cytochrome c n=1 Tax=Geomonas limicola TaxID=2740186 RepID=A0A6V8N1Z1_9BACT|nr:cytochrome C [Geomonas limicola]GFO66431.1 cytochrome c [Geomonas limicola]